METLVKELTDSVQEQIESLLGATSQTFDEWESTLSSVEHYRFFFQMVQRTIDHIISANYLQFDALTTSNCCHGLSILAREWILQAQKLDLQALKNQVAAVLTSLEKLNCPQALKLSLITLPAPILDLASLHVLTEIVEIDPRKGRRTYPKKLKNICNISTKFCIKLVKYLQKKISYIVAKSYSKNLNILGDLKWINKISIKTWGQYIEEPNLRRDKRGTLYASALYSMQVSLAYLAKSNAPIALVIDIIEPKSLKLVDRYSRLLTSINNQQFIPLEDLENNKFSDKDPVLVFGGYVSSEHINLQTLSARIEPWVYQIASLILACDTHYPQFPQVGDDSDFNNSPILAKEVCLNTLISQLSEIPGTSFSDPTLFCLSHIFLSNIPEISNIQTSADRPVFHSCFTSNS